MEEQTEGRAHRTGRRSRVEVPLVSAIVGAAALVAVAFAGVSLGRVTGGNGGQTAVLDSVRSTAASGTVTVVGTGTVKGIPDTVSFQIGVSTNGASASSALAENDGQVRSLEQSLEHHGVKTSEMQTSGLNLSVNTNSSGAVTGFNADDTLNVTMHGIKLAGEAIDAAANAVGNGIQLYGISFSISNRSALLAAARSAAMHSARTKAEQLAAGAGGTLGGILKVSEDVAPSPVVYGYAAPVAFAASAVPFRQGRQPVTVQVTVVYSLRT